MTDRTHDELPRIFNLVLAAPPDQRRGVIERECRGDAALRQRLESMLRAADSGAFTNAPTVDPPSRAGEGVTQEPSASEQATVTSAMGAHPGSELVEGPGSRIGPFKILQLIGQGGFGSVFMAQQEHPVQRKVALKIIKLGMDTRQVVARFEQERQALAMMDHPNIARVLDAGATSTGRPYFVMELVKGDPITDYCDRNNLSVRERLELFAQVCSAVQHAHTKGIIHRDIKPSNILVSIQDGRPTTKVIDFGIAKATNAQLTEKTLFTEHRQLIGTPEYMSPEQAEGNLDIDTRTDVYSLGVLLYELLTGTTPFSGGELRSAGYAEIQRIIREVEPPKPSTRLSDSTATIASIAAHRHTEPKRLGTILRGELDWIVMRALEKDRQRRYETANGLAMDVRRYLDGEPVVAAPPSAAYRFKKLIRRHKGAVTGAAVVTAALVLGLVGTGYGLRREAAARLSAQREAERATKAEAEASARADELALVVDFQGGMLEQVDPTKAGESLTTDVLQRFSTAVSTVRPPLPESQRAEMNESFKAQWSRVNATDAARNLIDRTILKPSIKTIDERFKDRPVISARLQQALAERYITLGLYNEAMPLLTSALATRRTELGDDDPATINSMEHMGQLLGQMGKPAEAEPFWREAVERRRRVQGEDHERTISSVNNLGDTYRSMNQFDKAEPLLRASLESMRRVRGNDHPQTMAAMNKLGQVYIRQGEIVKGEALWREAYETGVRTLGESNQDVLIWMHNLGMLLREQGKMDEAEALVRRSMEGMRRALGEEHPTTLAITASLTRVLQSRGNLGEAELLLRDILDKQRRSLGSDHPSTVLTLTGIGQSLRSQGKLAEAEPFLREALESNRRARGAEHIDTIVSMSELGRLQGAQGKFVEAESLHREALDIARRTLGPEHRQTLLCMNSLAVLYQDQRRFAEAEPLCREQLEARRRLDGESHSETLIAMNLLARLYFMQGKSSEAESLWRQAYERGVESLGADSPDVLVWRLGLCAALKDLGRFDEAEPLQNDAMVIAKRVLGEENPTTLRAISEMGGLRLAQGKNADAVTLLASIEGRARSRFVGTTESWLGTLLANLGAARGALAESTPEFTQAETNLVEGHEILQKAGGTMPKGTRNPAQSLADLHTRWHKAEPGAGHDAKAAEWAAKVPAK